MQYAQVIREIPCSNCGSIFGQTTSQMKRSITRCPSCRKVMDKEREGKRRPASGMGGPKSYLEIVLPKKYAPFYDKVKDEWTMRVRVRKRNSDEPFAFDRIYLGVKGRDANSDTVRGAYTAAYSRMEMEGRSSKTVEQIRKKLKRNRRTKRDRKYSWKQGIDRDLGVKKVRITHTMYDVHLPDPVIDGKKHSAGKFKTRAEARAARDALYRTLKTQHVPCAVCGRLPTQLRGILTHLHPDCTNRFQMPPGIRPLLQAKLWNVVFSKGPGVGVLTQKDLGDMGYLKQAPRGFRYYARVEVEFNFKLAKTFAKKPDPDEDVGFE